MPAIIQNGRGNSNKFSALATQFDILLHMTINKVSGTSEYVICDTVAIVEAQN